MATIDFGFGVDMSRDQAQFREGAALFIVQNLLSPEVETLWRVFREEHPELTDDAEAADMFCDEYTDEEGFYDGIEELLCRCMNDNECNGEPVFAYEDYCIFVGAKIPVDEADKVAMLTQEDIRRILAKYLNGEHVLKDYPNIETLEITD